MYLFGKVYIKINLKINTFFRPNERIFLEKFTLKIKRCLVKFDMLSKKLFSIFPTILFYLWGTSPPSPQTLQLEMQGVASGAALNQPPNLRFASFFTFAELLQNKVEQRCNPKKLTNLHSCREKL